MPIASNTDGIGQVSEPSLSDELSLESTLDLGIPTPTFKANNSYDETKANSEECKESGFPVDANKEAKERPESCDKYSFEMKEGPAMENLFSVMLWREPKTEVYAVMPMYMKFLFDGIAHPAYCGFFHEPIKKLTIETQKALVGDL